MVIREYEKLFKKLAPPEPARDLFERIILAIKREKELQKRKKLLLRLFSLSIISFVSIPFSWQILIEETRKAGTFYFISTAVSDFNAFFTFWPDFILAILESLPVVVIIVFSINMAFLLFSFRLFLYRKDYSTYLIPKIIYGRTKK